MRAIIRLKQAGMTRQQIANAIGATRQAVGFWERGLRSPDHDNRQKLIALAESRGVLLLAADFSKASAEE